MNNSVTKPVESEEVVEAVCRRAKAFFDGARGSHDWDHTRRVMNLCERLGSAEGADMTTLRIAACLHDVGRGAQDGADGTVCHATLGAQIAEPWVAGLPLTDDQQENVLHCIRTHRFRNADPPRTIEAKVLFDADKLDAIGAVGVARAFLFAGEVGACLHNPDLGDDVALSKTYSINDTGYREYLVKLRFVRERMLTVAGRQMAEARHMVMVRFFDEFLEEIDGRR